MEELNNLIEKTREIVHTHSETLLIKVDQFDLQSVKTQIMKLPTIKDVQQWKKEMNEEMES